MVAPRYVPPLRGSPRWLRKSFLALSVAILVSALFVVPLPQIPGSDCCSAYLETPGAALPLARSVSTEEETAGGIDGEYLVMTVNLRPATAWGWLRAQLFADASLQPRNTVVSGEISDRDYFQRQRTVFDTSAAVAASVGLEHAGYPVDRDQLTGSGALVARVIEGAPADGTLRPGDVITAVDGERIQVAEELRALLSEGSGERVVSVRRGSLDLQLRVAPGVISIDGESVWGIGADYHTANPRVALPISVQVDAGRIGGPSAGLLTALTVYDMLDPIDLAAGRRIAGTGTMAPDGTVGRIGGVRQKIWAAHRESADVFVVPESQVETAVEALPSNSTMRIIPVATFDEAVSALLATVD